VLHLNPILCRSITPSFENIVLKTVDFEETFDRVEIKGRRTALLNEAMFVLAGYCEDGSSLGGGRYTIHQSS